MGRLRLAVWSPLPPSPSGIADYVAESLPHLARHADVQAVTEDPASVDQGIARFCSLRRAGEAVEADLDVYHLGNSPAHAFVYRAALARPGVVFLHEWSLHHLVLGETVERGDVSTYLREMRRAHGETGTFVGRQVARGLGGDVLPALFALNDRILEGSLGVVGLSEHVRAAAARLFGRPVLRLPHHLWLPLDPIPSREEARRSLGLPVDGFIVTAPGLATRAKRLHVALRAVARLRERHPSLRMVVAGGVDPELPLMAWAREAGLAEAFLATGQLSLEDFVRHLAAADVVLCLRFPTHGEISGALVRALGVGRPVLVTAGTPAAEEFPEGIVVPVDPGPSEAAEVEALLGRLLEDDDLRLTIGRLAREHVLRHHDLASTAARLLAFLAEVERGKEAALAEIAARRAREGGLVEYLMQEVRWGAIDLGLPGVPPGLESLLSELAGAR